MVDNSQRLWSRFSHKQREFRQMVEFLPQTKGIQANVYTRVETNEKPMSRSYIRIAQSPSMFEEA